MLSELLNRTIICDPDNSDNCFADSSADKIEPSCDEWDNGFTCPSDGLNFLKKVNWLFGSLTCALKDLLNRIVALESVEPPVALPINVDLIDIDDGAGLSITVNNTAVGASQSVYTYSYTPPVDYQNSKILVEFFISHRINASRDTTGGLDQPLTVSGEVYADVTHNSITQNKKTVFNRLQTLFVESSLSGSDSAQENNYGTSAFIVDYSSGTIDIDVTGVITNNAGADGWGYTLDNHSYIKFTTLS